MRVTGRDLVNRAVLDKGAWAAGIAGSWSPELYLFAGNHRDRVPLHARSSPRGPAWTRTRDRIGVRVAGRQPGPSVTGTGRHLPYSDRPGRSHGRPSALEGTAHKPDGRIIEVIVGGHATIVGNGTMTLPA